MSFFLNSRSRRYRVAVAGFVQDGDLDGMCAGRQDLLRREVAYGIDRHFAAGDPDRVVRGYPAALDLDRAAAERNVVQRESALAIGREQLAPGGRGLRSPVAFLAIGRRIGVVARHSGGIAVRLVVEPQRLGIGFVEVAARVIGTEHEAQFVRRPLESVRDRLPLRKARPIDVDDRERHRRHGPAAVENPDLRALDEVAVVCVHPEPNRRRGGAIALARHRDRSADAPRHRDAGATRDCRSGSGCRPCRGRRRCSAERRPSCGPGRRLARRPP